MSWESDVNVSKLPSTAVLSSETSGGTRISLRSWGSRCSWQQPLHCSPRYTAVTRWAVCIPGAFSWPLKQGCHYLQIPDFTTHYPDLGIYSITVLSFLFHQNPGNAHWADKICERLFLLGRAIGRRWIWIWCQGPAFANWWLVTLLQPLSFSESLKHGPPSLFQSVQYSLLT